MAERPIPRGIQLKDQEIPLKSLTDAYAQTEYGDYLKTAVRYERYKPPHIDNQQWVRLLGADVQNFEHMQLTDGITRSFLSECRLAVAEGRGNDAIEFSEAEEEQLRLTARIHDWTEGVKGFYDITFSEKTLADEEGELSKLGEIIQDVVKPIVPDEENQAVLLEKMQSAIKDTLGNKETKTGKAFNAIERAGYLRTAQRAWKESKTNADDPALVNGLEWIVADVFGGQITQLLAYAETYPPIQRYLEATRDTISEAFLQLPPNAFDNYRLDQRQEKRDAFTNARDAWFRQFPQDVVVLKAA